MNRTEYTTAAEAYISALPSLKKSDCTARSYKMILRTFAEHLTSESAEQITPLSVVSFRRDLSERVKTNTVAHYLTVLHGFFEWARRVGLEQQNPVPTEEIPKAERIDYDLPTLDEISELLVCKRPRGTFEKNTCRNRAIVLLLLQSGVRSDELRSLTPDDLDFEKHVVRIKHGKGDKYREAPFPALAREAVAEYLKARSPALARTDYLFGSSVESDGRTEQPGVWHKMTSAALLGLVKRYVKNATGRDNVGVHDLRHAFASYASNKGVSTRNISLCLGHASESITERVYISILDKSKAPTTVNAALDA